MGADALKDVSQVFKGVDGEAFARRRQARQDCRFPAAVVTAKKSPVVPLMWSSA
jgi:hypothetical protein